MAIEPVIAGDDNGRTSTAGTWIVHVQGAEAVPLNDCHDHRETVRRRRGDAGHGAVLAIILLMLLTTDTVGKDYPP